MLLGLGQEPAQALVADPVADAPLEGDQPVARVLAGAGLSDQRVEPDPEGLGGGLSVKIGYILPRLLHGPNTVR